MKKKVLAGVLSMLLLFPAASLSQGQGADLGADDENMVGDQQVSTQGMVTEDDMGDLHNEDDNKASLSDSENSNLEPSEKPKDPVGEDHNSQPSDTREAENETPATPENNLPDNTTGSGNQDESEEVHSGEEKHSDIHKQPEEEELEGSSTEEENEASENQPLANDAKARSVGETNIQYQYNAEGQAILAQVYENGQVTKIHEYYPPEPESREQKIRFTFDLNADGHIIQATELARNNQQPIAKYQYYPATAYGNHGKRIKFSFALTESGYITRALEREAGTQRLVAVYEYYSGTTYGSHGKLIKFSFALNGSGHITRALEREAGTQRLIAAYEYHPGTTYGGHGKRIKFSFALNGSGHITRALEREVNTQKLKAVYEYYPGTTYGSHGKRINLGFMLDSYGNVKSAVKREAGTQRIISRYEYYPNAKYGQHGSKIKYVFDITSSGYIAKATLRAAGTGRILTTYGYYPNTSYGNHGAKIVSIRLNVPLVSQLPELPTGCEITAVTMMLNYKSVNVSKKKLADEMPRHSWDPNLGYVGNPYTKNGWTVYPPALMKIVNKYAGSARNVTGASHLLLEDLISRNHPVVLWASPMHGFTVHAITLTGYDRSYYYYNDPWTGQKDVKMEKSKLLNLWENQKKRAITY